MIKFSRLLVFVVAAAVMAGLVFAAVTLRGKRAQEHARAMPPVPAPWALHSATVSKRTVTSGFQALAVTKADSQVVVTPQISGKIISMGPREGQTFQPGTVLVRIDASEITDQIYGLKAELASARKQAEFLKKELSRQETLLKKGFATPEKTESARTAYIAAANKTMSLSHQLAQLKTKLGYATIVAQKSGTVAARMAEPGDLAAPGKPVYRLSVSGKTRFSIKVPQSVLEKMQVGGNVVLTYGNEKLTARLTRINKTLDALSMGSIDIDLATSPFKLPAGARVPARVITRQTSEALTVPPTAVGWLANDNSGFVIKATTSNNKTVLQKLPVKIIHAAADGVAVSGDIKAGDQVIVAQQAVLLKLKTGERAIIEPGVVQ